MDLLSKINSPADLRKVAPEDLPRVCDEVREYLIDTLASVGGHFASNLGVVELTVALHYVLNTPEDKLIWDVGHQIYPHKILTGRREQLRSVRRRGGLSGFPKREESVYDLYNTGHAGTSISQALGEAMARDRLGLNHQCVCVIGDASVASGMAFEALNHGGHVQTDCIVILNDNDMSISKNVGALNQYLNRLITSPTYNKGKRIWYSILMWLPLIGPLV
ncbi:MAG TPA: 1-deoxy-D-xylulose-5-phosphate synthase N-terminal domain-containing protein, partial [Leptospiraceae bacterium]|nr:1-deoxy-D-xylulose-5-phosphate synthase N-terminal domain-containing protein [Leptospiraceae bacterium]